MPEYQSADELLADAELRADGLGSGLGILVVEGPDDKRFFARHVVNLAQVVPAGGRRILLSAHERSSDAQRGKIVFVTDCDYEVRRGALHGGFNLIITTRTDLESDLIEIGLLEEIVVDMVPRALDSDQARKAVCMQLKTTAESIALPLGRVRMAAQPLGIDLKLSELRLHKYRSSASGGIDLGKLIDALHTKVSAALTLEEWRDLVLATPDDSGMCHGKDLIRAVAVVLKDDFRVGTVSTDQLASSLRLACHELHLASWDVARRIRRWQNAHERTLLR